MLACVFSNHVNNFYTNILCTVYIYNHTSHVGWWWKIFFLQCLYSKLLFLHRAQWPGLQCPVSLGCGVPINTPHYLIGDYRRVHARSSVCLHMWHTANLLPAFCFSFSPSLCCLSERCPPSLPKLPVSHNAPWPLSGCARGKKVLGCKVSLVHFTQQSPLFSSLPCASLTLLYQRPWGASSSSFRVVYMQMQLNGWDSPTAL